MRYCWRTNYSPFNSVDLSPIVLMMSVNSCKYFFALKKLCNLVKVRSYLKGRAAFHNLKVLMREKAKFCSVGDDDSGPEDLRMIWILSAIRCLCLKFSALNALRAHSQKTKIAVPFFHLVSVRTNAHTYESNRTKCLFMRNLLCRIAFIIKWTIVFGRVWNYDYLFQMWNKKWRERRLLH